MSLLGMAAVAVVAVVIGTLAIPVFAEQWSNDHDEGSNLAEATGATLRKADDLGTSFGSLIPARAEAATHEDGDGDGDSDGRTQAGPETPDFSDPSVSSDNDVEHDVAAALEALASVDPGRYTSATDERIAAIENLRDLWAPRYHQAQEEHRRLDYRIEHAERAARLYFKAQGELTRQIKNPEDRARATASDREEREVYHRWRDQAHRTRTQADRIIGELHDMDIIITKQLLSANFAAVYYDYIELPIALRDLHGDLEQFRARSEEIGAVFVEN